MLLISFLIDAFSAFSEASNRYKEGGDTTRTRTIGESGHTL